jgi:hypothetical protein
MRRRYQKGWTILLRNNDQLGPVVHVSILARGDRIGSAGQTRACPHLFSKKIRAYLHTAVYPSLSLLLKTISPEIKPLLLMPPVAANKAPG